MFLLTISYKKPFVFSVPVLCFQIFTTKLILGLKMGLTYATSIITEFLESFLFTNIFCFTDIKLLIFNYNIVKIPEILSKCNMVKTCIQTTYPIDFCIFYSDFYYRKK